MSSGCAALLNKKKTKFFNIAKNIAKESTFKIKGNALNSGKYGIVFNSNNSKYVVKISKFNKNTLGEVLISQIASDLKIGPEIPEPVQMVVYNKKHYMIMIMEKMNGTLESLLRNSNISSEDKLDSLRSVEMLLKILHLNNICHQDLHLKNIMYKKINNQYIIKLIDFGKSMENCKNTQKNLINIGSIILREKTRISKMRPTFHSPLKQMSPAFKFNNSKSFSSSCYNSPSPKKKLF